MTPLFGTGIGQPDVGIPLHEIRQGGNDHLAGQAGGRIDAQPRPYFEASDCLRVARHFGATIPVESATPVTMTQAQINIH